jgi:general secretion pathway protein F
MGLAFACVVVDDRGRRVRRLREGPTAAAVRQALETEGLLVIDVAEASGGKAPAGALFRPGSHDVLDFTRAIAGLLAAGLPLARALSASTGMLPSRMVALPETLRTQVERGGSIATALAQHPYLFSGLYVGLISAGERSGDLAAAFRRIAGHLEREADIRARLLSAALYPALLAVAGGLAVLILLFAVLPRFADILATSGARLPGSTALLLDLSTALRRWWPAGLLVVGATGLLLGWAASRREGRLAAMRLLAAIPGLGPLRRDLVAARTARLISVLLGGGVPVLSALEGAAESVADPLASEALIATRARVREGAALHRALAESGAFPPVMAQLTALGEQTGRLAEFLGKAADLLDDQVHRTMQRVVALAEPAMIVLFGGLVGFVALSLLQAIYSLNPQTLR